MTDYQAVRDRVNELEQRNTELEAFVVAYDAFDETGLVMTFDGKDTWAWLNLLNAREAIGKVNFGG